MTLRAPVLSLLLLVLGCTRPSTPAAEAPPAPKTAEVAKAPEAPKAAPTAAAPSQAARCSASSLSPEPAASRTPLPPAVESMRRRIIAAAVACDYEALAALTREKGAEFSFGFGGDKDSVDTWRQQEKEGELVLALLVKVLNLPHTQLDALYVWPSAYTAEPKPEDWKALESMYSAAELKELRDNPDGYVGFRTGIDASGDWQFAFSGD